MRKLADKYLVNTYPILYKDRYKSMQETAMCWGFQCGTGWFWLLRNLSETLKLLSKEYHLDITVSTVKEKLGTLSFYNSIEFNKLYEKEFNQKNFIRACRLVRQAVSLAEKASGSTCEKCGHWGKTRPGGYIVTMCDQCYANYKDRALQRAKRTCKIIKKMTTNPELFDPADPESFNPDRFKDEE